MQLEDRDDGIYHAELVDVLVNVGANTLANVLPADVFEAFVQNWRNNG